MTVVATARLQLGPDLTFAATGELVPYLAELGVSHLYLSPVFEARPGSTHGYDVVDPTRVANALGGRAGLERLAVVARDAGLGLVLDIVPNHLAAHECNPWWWSVLRDGPASPAAPVFDLDWSGGGVVPAGKLALPVLGAPLADELATGALTLARDGDELVVVYRDRRFPVAPGTRDGDLAAMLSAQHYVLVPWRDAARVRSYRRFFDIDDLVGVRVEDPAVFDRTHVLVLDLVASGVATGLRVDHIDGLADPRGYLDRLRAAVGPDVYLVVEKILGHDEALPTWPVDGTTGYEALAALDEVFVDPEGFAALDRDYMAAGGRPFGDVVAEAKAQALDLSFGPEHERLARDLTVLGNSAVVDAGGVVRALTLSLDVYRTYARAGEWRPQDWSRLRPALARFDPEARGAVEDVLRSSAPAAVDWVVRWQQLTGAVMAKGHEDTALYRHTRLLALNEVGADPDGPSRYDPVAHWHAANEGRRERAPHSTTTTSTHDTKRGEDTRARILALTEMPDAAAVLFEQVETALAASGDRDTARLVAQTVLGGWPASDVAWVGYDQRVADALRKAMREAKQRTSWSDPDRGYEDAVLAAVRVLLEDRGRAFAGMAAGLVERAELAGLATGLGRCVLHIAAPGVPDLYQGADSWVLTFVDPDNRRPVDWAGRAARLAAWRDHAPVAGELMRDWRDAGVKQWVVWHGLRARADDPSLFLQGAYLPLAASGRWAAHVVGFARVGPDGRVAIAAAARTVLAVHDAGGGIVGPAWDDTVLVVPQEVVVRDVLRPGAEPVAASRLEVSDLFAELPVALALGRSEP